MKTVGMSIKHADNVEGFKTIKYLTIGITEKFTL